MINKYRLVVPILLLTILCYLPGEIVRGKLTANTDAGEKSTEKIPFKLQELLSFSLDENPFLTGVELILEIPQEITHYRDGFAISLYSGITPDPEREVSEYQGNRLLFRVLPNLRRFSVQIPIKEAQRMPSAPGSIILDKPIPPERFPLLLTISPVMKGIPQSLSESSFTLTVNPIYEQKGMLILTLDSEEEIAHPRVFINNTLHTQNTSRYVLPVGIHQMRIEADGFQTVTRSFGIEQTQETRITVSMIKQSPKLVFHLPAGITIFLNGENIEPILGEPVEVSPGEHVLLIKIGDFRTSRRFRVEDNILYNISLFLDILIQEN